MEVDEEGTTDQPVVEPPRKPLFTAPRFREDLRALPSLFRTRRALWIPVVLLFVGFGLMYALLVGAVPPDMVGPAELYIQFFFLPFGLFTFFIGGFLAPRASYLVGLVLGLLSGVLWTILIMIGATVPAAPGTEAAPITDPATESLRFFTVAVVYGTLAGAFAGWYRDFLRQMQARGQQRRAEREEKEKARRREERRLGKRAG